MKVEFFKSSKVGGNWRQGVHLQRRRWHSCMQWGWTAIREGKRIERWCDYFVLTFCWRHYGMCWHFYPKEIRS